MTESDDVAYRAARDVAVRGAPCGAVPSGTGRGLAMHRIGVVVPSDSVTGPLGDTPPPEQLMTVTRNDRNTRPVLTVSGEVDLSTGDRLREMVSTVLQQPDDGPVILDLSGVQFLSSSGLGHLVALDEEGRRLARPLRIVVDETRSVIRPITTMGLDDVLSLFETVDDAMAGMPAS